MRLLNYILEDSKDGRGKNISEEDALKLIPQYSIALKSIFDGRLSISRNIPKRWLKFYLIDPKKGKRRSANTLNYYTFIMDNSKKWSKYPKRSKSVICSSIEFNLRYMDDPENYIVLPKNGAKIGECSSDDLWYSFSKIDVSMDDFSRTLNLLLNYPNYTDEKLIDINKTRLKVYDKSYSMFKKASKNFDNWIKNETELSTKEIKEIHFMSWLNDWDGKTPILKYIDDILDPKKNDFKISTIKNIMNINVEVWTDSECLMINEVEVENFLEKVKKLI